MLPLAQMLPALDLKDALTVGGVLVALAMGWAKFGAEQKRSVERHDETRKTLEAIRDEAGAGRQLAQEALRQAQSAHVRVDSLTLQQQALEVAQARLDERQRLRTTQRIRPVDEES